MTAGAAEDIFKCICIANDKIPVQISLKFVPMCSIDVRSALVQVTAWRRGGDMPVPGPIVTQFTDAYMRH